MGDVVDDATSGDGVELADGLGGSVGAVVGVNDREGEAFAGEGGEVLEVVHAAISFPHAVHPGRSVRAKISRPGPGETRSITS